MLTNHREPVHPRKPRRKQHRAGPMRAGALSPGSVAPCVPQHRRDGLGQPALAAQVPGTPHVPNPVGGARHPGRFPRHGSCESGEAVRHGPGHSADSCCVTAPGLATGPPARRTECSPGGCPSSAQVHRSSSGSPCATMGNAAVAHSPYPGDRADGCPVAPDCTVCSVQPPPSAL